MSFLGGGGSKPKIPAPVNVTPSPVRISPSTDAAKQSLLERLKKARSRAMSSEVQLGLLTEAPVKTNILSSTLG